MMTVWENETFLKPYKVYCSWCNKAMNKDLDNLYDVDGEPVCRDCMENTEVEDIEAEWKIKHDDLAWRNNAR